MMDVIGQAQREMVRELHTTKLLMEHKHRKELADLNEKIEVAIQRREPIDAMSRWGEGAEFDVYPSNNWYCTPCMSRYRDDGRSYVNDRGYNFLFSICIVDDYGSLQIWDFPYHDQDNQVDENLAFYWGGMPGRPISEIPISVREDMIRSRGSLRIVDMRSGRCGAISKVEEWGGYHIDWDDGRCTFMAGYLGDIFCLV